MYLKNFFLAVIIGCNATLVGYASPVLGQERSAAFGELLSLVPAELVNRDTLSEIAFGDVRPARTVVALAQIGGYQELPPEVAALARVAPPTLALYLGIDPEEWRASVGFGQGDIETVLSAWWLPEIVNLMRLGPGVGAQTEAQLLRSGYQFRDRMGTPVLMRSEGDYEIDLLALDPADPFGRGFGSASRVWIAGDLLRQSSGWPEMDQMLAPEYGRLSDNLDVVRLLAALDDDRAGPGQLASATMFLGVEEQGLPRAFLLADLVHGVQDRTVLALRAPDMARAGQIAAAIRQNWAGRINESNRRSFADLITPEVEIWVLEGTDPVVVVQFSLPRTTEERVLQNRGYQRLRDAVYSLDLAGLFDPPISMGQDADPPAVKAFQPRAFH